MTLKSDAKSDEQLTSGLENDMRNLAIDFVLYCKMADLNQSKNYATKSKQTDWPDVVCKR